MVSRRSAHARTAVSLILRAGHMKIDRSHLKPRLAYLSKPTLSIGMILLSVQLDPIDVDGVGREDLLSHSLGVQSRANVQRVDQFSGRAFVGLLIALLVADEQFVPLEEIPDGLIGCFNV